VLQPSTRGQGALLEQSPADQGTTEFPPETEGSQSATPEEVQPVAPVCQEGLEFDEGLGFCVPTDCPESQVLDEEVGICVLEGPEVTEEEPEQQSGPGGRDQQQSSDQGENSEDIQTD
jgi:hypothetical protein